MKSTSWRHLGTSTSKKNGKGNKLAECSKDVIDETGNMETSRTRLFRPMSEATPLLALPDTEPIIEDIPPSESHPILAAMNSPLVSATLQSTALGCTSNVVAQFLEAWRKEFHWDQFIRFMILTFVLMPPNYYWQILLERTFPGRKPVGHSIDDIVEMGGVHDPSEIENLKNEQVEGEREGGDRRSAEGLINAGAQGDVPKTRLDWRNTFTKWFIDCITMGALLNTVAFLVLMGILKGYSGSLIWQQTRDETIPIIVAGYKIWPFASVLNFTIIPVEKRTVFLSFVALWWDVYLSLVAAEI